MAGDALPRLTFHEVDAARWPDLVRLFEARGGPSSCWCMVWRRMPDGASRRDQKGTRAALSERVATGTRIGISATTGTGPSHGAQSRRARRTERWADRKSRATIQERCGRSSASSSRSGCAGAASHAS